MAMFEDRLAIEKYGAVSLLSNPWHYKEMFNEESVEGFDPPVWVYVFNGALPFEETPPSENPRPFDLEDGHVIPKTQPVPRWDMADDVYIVIKDWTLKFIAHTSTANFSILFDDEVIIPSTVAEARGTTYDLAPTPWRGAVIGGTSVGVITYARTRSPGKAMVATGIGVLFGWLIEKSQQ